MYRFPGMFFNKMEEWSMQKTCIVDGQERDTRRHCVCPQYPAICAKAMTIPVGDLRNS